MVHCIELNFLSRVDHLLWHVKVQYRFHKSPPLNPTQSKLNPVHNLTTYLSKIYFNIIFPCMLMTLKSYLPLWFLNSNSNIFLISPAYAT